MHFQILKNLYNKLFCFRPHTFKTMHPDDDDDEIDGPSAEDLYIDLEHEMSKISPYTCPTRVRILLAKVAFKVHKEKDPG